MAITGYTNITATAYDTLQFYWNRTDYSIEDNETTVYWELRLISGTYGKIISSVDKAWAVNVNGTDYSGTTSISIGNNQTKVLASDTTTIKHDADGSKTFSYSFSQAFHMTFAGSSVTTISGSGSGTLDSIPRQATITYAPNFTDEENPTITISNPAGSAVDYVEVGIYDTAGAYAYAAYRELDDPTDESYTFTLTSEEKDRIYESTKDSKEPLRVKFFVATKIGDYWEPYAVERTITIVNASPVIDEVSALALGRPGTVISGHNYMEFNFTAHAVKGASVVRRTVTCGNKTVEIDENNYGALENVTSGYFVFTVTDSRGNSMSEPVTQAFIPYTKPTCNIDVDMMIVEESTAQAKLTISGNAYGNIIDNETGEVNNSTVSYRWKTFDGEYCDWITLADYALYDYSFEDTIPDLDDKTTYVFQARIFDNIYTENVAITITEYGRATPVCDWSYEDFAFNVPVTVEGKTVRTIGSTARIARAYTQEEEIEYEENSYIKLFREGSPTDLYNTEIATFEDNGLITINKDMLAFVNIHIPANTAGEGRSWIRLMNYDADWYYTSSLEYGTWTTSQINTVLKLTKGTRIGVVTAEKMVINSGGHSGAYIEIIEL